MDVTISLDESLSAQLRQEACARKLSPEQTARDLLGGALDKLAEQQLWREVHRRRGELIRRSRDLGLTAEEGRELDRLQAEVDQRLAPVDRQLLAAAEQIRKLAAGLPDAPGP